MRQLTAALLVFLSLAAPAAASTLPSLDFSEGQSLVSVGIADINLDYAVNDLLSLGVSYIPGVVTGGPFAAAARGTLQLGQTEEGLKYGLTVSAGAVANLFGGSPTTQSHMFWLQPALNVQVPLGAARLRATVGPVLFNGFATAFPFALWPNVELAIPVRAGQEFVLGGNSLAGWRSTF